MLHEDALAAFADLAKRLRLRWYVFGAQAVNLHGFPRATADLDLTIDLAQLTPSALIRELESAGFSARFTDDDFITATRVIPIVHHATKLPIESWDGRAREGLPSAASSRPSPRLRMNGAIRGEVVGQVVMQSIAETTDGRRLVGNRPSSRLQSVGTRGIEPRTPTVSI